MPGIGHTCGGVFPAVHVSVGVGPVCSSQFTSQCSSVRQCNGYVKAAALHFGRQHIFQETELPLKVRALACRQSMRRLAAATTQAAQEVWQGLLQL